MGRLWRRNAVCSQWGPGGQLCVKPRGTGQGSHWRELMAFVGGCEQRAEGHCWKGEGPKAGRFSAPNPTPAAERELKLADWDILEYDVSRLLLSCTCNETFQVNDSSEEFDCFWVSIWAHLPDFDSKGWLNIPLPKISTRVSQACAGRTLGIKLQPQFCALGWLLLDLWMTLTHIGVLHQLIYCHINIVA